MHMSQIKTIKNLFFRNTNGQRRHAYKKHGKADGSSSLWEQIKGTIPQETAGALIKVEEGTGVPNSVSD